MPEESLFADEQWYGVVTVAYLRVHNKIGNDGEITATLRKGDMVRIYQIRHFYDSNKKIWKNYYFIEESNNNYGWADSELIDLYDYEITAKQAQSILEVQM